MLLTVSRRIFALALACALLLCVPPAQAESELATRLKPLCEAHRGSVAVAVENLATGERYGYRDDEPMPTASLIKVAVMIEAYRQAEGGKISLTELVTLREEDKVPGSGILTPHFSAGAQLPLRDAVRLMISHSDNTATNVVLDRIGLASTAESMQQLGLPNTKIHAKVFRRDTSLFPERSEKFGLGSTTAAEMVRLLGMLHRHDLAGQAACAEMLGHLRACEDKMLARRLPAGTKTAHKTGTVTGVRTVGAILESPRGPVALCILTSENEDTRTGEEGAADLLCGTIARSVYDYFDPGSTPDTEEPPAELREGARGWLVQALQRTLNQRLSPSPKLTTDGEFGPATKSAVLRFQQSRKLPATGIVGRETWRALGSLTADGASPSLSTSEVAPLPEVLPADLLDGPPFVTCRAWGIGNAETGELLWGSNESERLDIASTTKLMTALVVLRTAETQPTVLDEIVVVSRRADQTPGSTAEVRSGERLSVRELLYGLLLPSGNDASVALAEHFGGRFAPPANSPDAADPLDRFIAEMNRTAVEFGMNDTNYVNPHGLTAEGHRSSVRDLLKLASIASGNEHLQKYVGTRRHVGRVESGIGYSREIVWANTNQLLNTEGYRGLKTGTTSAAGACLVSLGCRGDERLIVVVLGSTSGDARYTDSRNLYRWAWQQRGHGR